MPHRKGLGDLALDQKAENIIGRLVLLRRLEPELGLAADTYRSQWQSYVYSLGGPEVLTNGVGHQFTCDGCAPSTPHCRCWMRKRIYLESRRVLLTAGPPAVHAVWLAAVLDQPPADYSALRAGLTALAAHFGLIARGNLHSINAASRKPRTDSRANGAANGYALAPTPPDDSARPRRAQPGPDRPASEPSGTPLGPPPALAGQSSCALMEHDHGQKADDHA